MTGSLRKTTEEFFSNIKEQIYHKAPTIQCILFLGSYTRNEKFNDIDILTTLSGPYATNEELIASSENDRKYFKESLSCQRVWNIPPIQNFGYIGILQNPSSGKTFTKRNVENEIDQMKEQIRSFYDFYAGFNELSHYERTEYGIDKPPSDFRFSPEHSIFIERNQLDTQLKDGAIKMIQSLNSEFEQKVSNYKNIETD